MFALQRYAAAILAASVHVRHHEREMVAFVKEHRDELEQLPTAFLSVSLAEASAEDPKASPARRAQAAAEVQHVLESFFEETGWHPDRVRPVAGALLYREYGLLVRFVMKQIVKREGGDADTSRNYDYTDWAALDAFIEGLGLPRAVPPAQKTDRGKTSTQPDARAPEAPHDAGQHPHPHPHHDHVISPPPATTSYLNPGAVTIRR
jgi:menaquinone-dependent protoporphyrinogen IX oxidase